MIFVVYVRDYLFYISGSLGAFGLVHLDNGFTVAPIIELSLSLGIYLVAAAQVRRS